MTVEVLAGSVAAGTHTDAAVAGDYSAAEASHIEIVEASV